jgi:hypothetical protein
MLRFELWLHPKHWHLLPHYYNDGVSCLSWGPLCVEWMAVSDT